MAVDGESGRVILQIEGPASDEYERHARIYHAVAAELRQTPPAPAVTRDGVKVSILANAGVEEEAAAAAAAGAEGIGLLRTEFLCLYEEGPPSEEQHEAAYRRIAAAVGGRVVTVRLLDLAPDKLFPLGDDLPVGDLPIAERGIHYLLRNPHLLRAQLRGVLRAGDSGNFRLLLPMVAGVTEIARVRELLAELAQELRREGIARCKPVPVGAMIETVPAVLMAPEIARAADFLSLGTNDLLGFLLGARRDDTGEPISGAAFEPSLFRAIHQVVQAASAAGKDVSICGEIAGAPAFTKLLLGLGVRVLSMGLHRIAEVRYVVSETDIASARQLAEEVLSLRTAAEVRDLVLAQVDPWQLLLRRRASEG